MPQILQPAAQPESPMARRLNFGRGWQAARPGEPRWAYGPAALSYYNPYTRPLPAQIRLVMKCASRGSLPFMKML